MTMVMTPYDKAQLIAKRISSDRYAPHYHFIAPEGNALPFDPNGALYWKGKYHLFYIFQDPNLPHGGHCWGHASSSNLLQWSFHPTALSPNQDDPELGIFSGNAFISKEGIPTLAYYGINAGICLAQSTDDDLNEWIKFPDNPVIPEPKAGDPGWNVYNVFDPHIWYQDNTYYAILGGNVKPHQLYDTAYLFQSTDLLDWKYLRHFYNPHPGWTEPIEDCACPDFFKLGNRDILVCISHSHGARYYVGTFQDGTYIPTEHHRMNWPGGSCFAPETLLDDQQRRIFWAWVPDQRMGDSVVKNDLGVMTLPRVLSIGDNGILNIQPPVEYNKLRENHHYIESLVVSSEQDLVLNDIQGDCLEIQLQAEIPTNSVFGIKLLMSPDCMEQTVIRLNTITHTISIDTTQSSLRTDIYQPFPLMRYKARSDIRVQTAPFVLKQEETLHLRIFVDKSILGVFANTRQCVTQRIYPSRPDSLLIGFFSLNNTVVVNTLNIWHLMPTNPHIE